MSFFSKIAELINGKPSNVGKTEENVRNDASPNRGDFTPVHDRQGEELAEYRDINPSRDSRAFEASGAGEFAFDKSLLRSTTLSEQRYGWHRYLLAILSSLKNDKSENLKHLTIYVQKKGLNYKWNDSAFKAELCQALNNNNLSHVGSSSIAIEVVSDKVFKQLNEKTVNDTQYKQLFDDVILFGSRKETAEQKFATAIDKRAYVINELLKRFRSSTGTDTRLMENLVIAVVRNDDDDDMAKYDWIGSRFVDDLKRELTNAFLEKIGSKSLQIIFTPLSETDDCISLIDNRVYYKWGIADASGIDRIKEIPYERVTATLSIIEGTGSMMKQAYILDSDHKKIYHIGRGVTSRKGGNYRVNDIVVKDKETDQELSEYNGHVSSAHADIVFKNNRFYVKAATGGCRATGGSPTKIVRDENATELRDTNLLFPLEEGDIIELGKSVLLIYSLTDTNSL